MLGSSSMCELTVAPQTGGGSRQSNDPEGASRFRGTYPFPGRALMIAWDRALALTVISAILGGGFSPPTAGICRGDEPVFSGPQPGESLPPLPVAGVYDDRAGTTFDPVQDAGDQPTLLVFVHKLSRPGVAVTRAITNYAESIEEPQEIQDTAKAIETWVGEKRQRRQQLKRMAAAVLKRDLAPTTSNGGYANGKRQPRDQKQPARSPIGEHAAPPIGTTSRTRRTDGSHWPIGLSGQTTPTWLGPRSIVFATS